MRIYAASSWRNTHQPQVVQALRDAGHEVYDFRNPRPGDNGFRWVDIDPNHQHWTPAAFCEALQHPIAEASFQSDWGGMEWADVGVLILPCGRSAHLEAGYFVGAAKYLFILIPPGVQIEPELMYLMSDRICLSLDELIARLAILNPSLTPQAAPAKIAEASCVCGHAEDDHYTVSPRECHHGEGFSKGCYCEEFTPTSAVTKEGV
jgi:hypothetical protein